MRTTNERFIESDAADEFRLLCKKIAEMDALWRAGLPVHARAGHRPHAYLTAGAIEQTAGVPRA